MRFHPVGSKTQNIGTGVGIRAQDIDNSTFSLTAKIYFFTIVQSDQFSMLCLHGDFKS